LTNWPYGIRRAEAEDAGLIGARFSALMGAYDTGLSGLWADWCQRDDHYLYLLEKEQPEGLVAVRRVEEALRSDTAQAEIIAWYLGKSTRGSKLGRKLLVHGLTVAKRLECQEVVLWLPSSAGRAYRIAVGLGFSSAYCRETNTAEGAVKERGLCLDLEDYF